MRKFGLIFLAIFLVGCASKPAVVDEYKVIEQFKDEKIASDIYWYRGYNDAYLNELVDMALANNYDLANAALNLKRAYINAGLAEADYFPTLSGDVSAGANRDTSRSEHSVRAFSSGISLSYELDLFGKIYANNKSAQWKETASAFDLENTKLTIINSVVDAYFYKLYLEEALGLYEQNLANYNELKRIAKAKYDLGRSEYSEMSLVEQSVLNMQSQILSIKQNIATNDEFLRNLIASGPNFALKSGKKLSQISPLGVNLNVPYYTLGNRPDLRALIANLNASYFDYKYTYRSFFPSVTLGASLSDSDDNLGDSFGFNLLGGSVRINLPFLDMARMEKKIDLSAIDFEAALNEYQSALISAQNEVAREYSEYKIAKSNLSISQKNLANNIELENIDRVKYDYGKSELKDYLDAKNTTINSRISLLRNKYDILSNEIAIYKSMAGRFVR